MHLTRGRRLGFLAAAIVAIVVVVALIVGGDDRGPVTTTKRAEAFLRNVGCISTTTTREPVAPVKGYLSVRLAASATALTTVVCHDLGGFVYVLGYASPAARAAAFTHRPRRHRSSYCASGDDIVITQYLLAGPPQASRTCPALLATRG